MSKWTAAVVLDPSLQYIKDNTTKLLLVRTYAPGDSYATVVANRLAEVTLIPGDFTIASNGTGRRVMNAAKPAGGNASANSQQYDNGTATGGTLTTLVDAAKAWVVNVHAGRAVAIIAGTGIGQYGRIASNTATALTVPAWAVAPDATSVYRIGDDMHWVATNGANAVHYATPETTKQAITSPNPVDFPALPYDAIQPI